MQSPQQAPEQAQAQKPKREYYFKPGMSGNPAGRESAAARRERFERKVDEIAREYGGVAALSPTEVELVRQCADLLMLRPADVDQRVRIANACTRIFARLGDRRRKPAETESPLRQYLATLDRTEA